MTHTPHTNPIKRRVYERTYYDCGVAGSRRNRYGSDELGLRIGCSANEGRHLTPYDARRCAQEHAAARRGRYHHIANDPQFNPPAWHYRKQVDHWLCGVDGDHFHMSERAAAKCIQAARAQAAVAAAARERAIIHGLEMDYACLLALTGTPLSDLSARFDRPRYSIENWIKRLAPRHERGFPYASLTEKVLADPVYWLKEILDRIDQGVYRSRRVAPKLSIKYQELLNDIAVLRPKAVEIINTGAPARPPRLISDPLDDLYAIANTVRVLAGATYASIAPLGRSKQAGREQVDSIFRKAWRLAYASESPALFDLTAPHARLIEKRASPQGWLQALTDFARHVALQINDTDTIECRQRAVGYLNEIEAAAAGIIASNDEPGIRALDQAMLHLLNIHSPSQPK